MDKDPVRKDLSPVVFRGEPDGKLRAVGSWLRPYFFTEDLQQARLYARGTEPIACVVTGDSVLDLTALDPLHPPHAEFLAALEGMFDDWTCRYSGEPRSAWEYIEAGTLYDYEGTGSAERWNAALRLALQAHDAVRILDCTDGTNGQAVPIWVTQDRSNLRLASPGEHLAGLIHSQPWAATRSWIAANQSGLLERINRLTCVDTQFRLDKVHEMLPRENLLKMNLSGKHAQIWRALPAGEQIRPGDWVTLSEQYANHHLKHLERSDLAVAELDRVAPGDLFWAGTDERELFYMPSAWLKDGMDEESYLRSLSPEQIRILCDGEQASLARFSNEIAAVRAAAEQNHEPQAAGLYHGVDHWARVAAHGMATSRALGIDPLVSQLFAWVHDCLREDDGQDPQHGPRAAEFIRQRQALFGFLSKEQMQRLVLACELHSEGRTDGAAEVLACWDADRLDLWRVGIRPRHELLCTQYARSDAVIDEAIEFCEEQPAPKLQPRPRVR